LKGNVGDSLDIHDGMMFSTKDNDNDWGSSQNCASDHYGAWWYKSCYRSNLNTLYGKKKTGIGFSPVEWKTMSWLNFKERIEKVEMKMRPHLF
jgi:ficolin